MVLAAAYFLTEIGSAWGGGRRYIGAKTTLGVLQVLQELKVLKVVEN